MTASMTEVTTPKIFAQDQLDTFLSVPGVRKVVEENRPLLIPHGSDYDGPRSIDVVIVYASFWYVVLPKWFRRRLRIRISNGAPSGVLYQVRYKAWW